jgi:hypothetical protein
MPVSISMLLEAALLANNRLCRERTCHLDRALP